MMEKSREELIAEAAVSNNMPYDELERIVSSIEDMCETISEAIYQVFKCISQVITGIFEEINYIKKKKSHEYNWHVPQKIVMNHQVLDRTPTVPHMRNRL